MSRVTPIRHRQSVQQQKLVLFDMFPLATYVPDPCDGSASAIGILCNTTAISKVCLSDGIISISAACKLLAVIKTGQDRLNMQQTNKRKTSTGAS